MSASQMFLRLVLLITTLVLLTSAGPGTKSYYRALYNQYLNRYWQSHVDNDHDDSSGSRDVDE